MARNSQHDADTDTEAAIDGNHGLPIDPDLGIESADGPSLDSTGNATGHAAGRDAAAAGDLFGSLGAGLAATSLGLTIGRAIVAHRSRVRGKDRDREREMAVDAA